ncbi:phosphonate metabolism protein/1,5-bisphosphokinase (PRPP-forming) PhnN [Microbacterium marinilacus]|uniref:Ribose 1,5-bisphosphate phosphokinase PhnN n=1 Tax=Microbacterium marinilacus TaxID=415209 RepID=A0ABP7B4J4_9MICO|nr:phosphonate metabolism protein/1,5-bisphosphokinase (PRPP-forming) PhnN [Microbacterium marinilacus]MBY0687759.1 phosphonate metabolism protein/1,5-bisphosphokinase (PRPP-forming) PhnN [Microbacterium marinilacus]
MSGAFVAVMGPSGVGKDAVIGCAKDLLADGTGRYVFARRVITRPAGPAEECTSVTEDRFAALERRGAFALSWRAHGLAYGIPDEYATHVRDGSVVVGNVSRSVLTRLDERFARSLVVRITVPDHVRRARIAARGREDDLGAAARLHRADPAPGHRPDLEIVNDGALADAGETLAAFLREVAAVGSSEMPPSSDPAARSRPENTGSPSQPAQDG